MFGPEVEAAHLRLAAAFERLFRTRSAWELTGPLATTSPIAGAELRREPVQIAPALNEFLDAGVPGFGFSTAGGIGVEFYPGFLVLRGSDSLRLATALQAKLEFAEAAVAEPGGVPSDAVRGGSTWERTNKDGSPDKRVTNNRMIPIVRYGFLKWSAPGEAAKSYLVSDFNAAHAFATAFADYQSVLADEVRRPPPGAGRKRLGEGAVLLGLNPVISTVPPPPDVSPAHEYTAASAVGVLAIWLALSTPAPLGAERTGSQPPRPTAAAAVPSPTAGPTEPVGEPSPVPTAPTPVSPTQSASPASREAPMAATTTTPTSSAAPAHPPAPTTTADVREQTRTRTGANVRSAPNGTADVVRTVASGARLSVFGRSGGWVRVGEGDAWGWIHSSLLEPVN